MINVRLATILTALALLIGLFACAEPALALEKSHRFQYAMKFLKAGRLVAAKEVLIGIILEDPGYWPAHYQLGNIYLSLGKDYEAELHYQDCLKAGCDPRIAAHTRKAINHINRQHPELFAPTIRETKAKKKLARIGRQRLTESRQKTSSKKREIISEAHQEASRIQKQAAAEVKQMEQNSPWWYYNTYHRKMVSVVDPEFVRQTIDNANEYAQKIIDEAEKKAERIKPPTEDDVTTGLQSQLTRSKHSTIRLKPEGTNIYLRNYEPIERAVEEDVARDKRKIK